MKEIKSLEQCASALQWFKSNGYIVFGSGGMEDGSEGFMISFIKDSKKMYIYTRDKEIEKYIFEVKPWYWKIKP